MSHLKKGADGHLLKRLSVQQHLVNACNTGGSFTCCRLIYICDYSYGMFDGSGLGSDTSNCFTGNWGALFFQTTDCNWALSNAVASGYATSGVTLDPTTSFLSYNTSTGALDMELWTVSGDLLWSGLAPAFPIASPTLGQTGGDAPIPAFLQIKCSRDEVLNCTACTDTLNVVLAGSMLDGCDEFLPNNDGDFDPPYVCTRDGDNCSWKYEPIAGGPSITVYRDGLLRDAYYAQISGGSGVGTAPAAFMQPGCPVSSDPPCPPLGAYNPIHKSWVNRTFSVS